jgi:polyphosphate kinase
VKPALATAGVRILSMSEADEVQVAFCEHYFDREVGPVLTPFTLDPAHPLPHLLSQALCLGVLLEDETPDRARRLGIVPVPRVLPRLVRMPGGMHDYVTLADLAATFIGKLYPSRRIVAVGPFRVTRNANLDVDEESARDLLTAIEDELRHRRRGDIIRFEVSAKASDELRARLLSAFDLGTDDLYVVEGPGHSPHDGVYADVAEPTLKTRRCTRPRGRRRASRSSRACARGRAAHHPYESFETVVRFVEQAAEDPAVLAIKMTLYRTGGDSPLIRALARAAENGKQVTAIVELKARFDEALNIAWARRLEESGVHVVYGLIGLKTHAKLCLVVRREGEGPVRYAHIGTGNYTRRPPGFTDFGLMTSTEIGRTPPPSSTRSPGTDPPHEEAVMARPTSRPRCAWSTASASARRPAPLPRSAPR